MEKHAPCTFDHLMETLKWVINVEVDMWRSMHLPPLPKKMLNMDRFTTYNKLKVTTYGNVPENTTLWAPSHVSPPIMEICGLD